jgi:dimethylamine monooxygenase subunit C
MLVQGIKSRPVYHGAVLDPNARKHLFILEGEGPLSILEQNPPAAEMAKADILYVAAASKPKAHENALAALKPNDLWAAPTIPILLNRLNIVLGQQKMGTRLYISGTEGFIGQAMQVALSHGIDFNSIKTEHRGSEARRVQCVHCKGITENVRTQPVTCSHCGLSLLVRDHYSRRIGAFQGVCIDAEEPGTAPAPEELFP